MSTTRAIALGLLIGLLPLLVVLAATSELMASGSQPAGAAAATDELSAQLDPARVDETLARYAATPAAGQTPNPAWTSGGLPSPRPITTTRAYATTPAPRPLSPAPAVAPPLIAGQPAIRPAPAAEIRKTAVLGAAVPPSVRRWETQIAAAAARSGVDPNLIAALMMTESGGSPDATSDKGAIGLMQIVGGPREPAANVEQGTAILAGHLARYGRNDLALAAYNAGPGAVQQYGGVPPYRETRDHVFRVLVRYDLYSR